MPTFTISAQRAALGDGVQAATLTVADGVIAAVTPGADPAADVALGPDDVLLPGAVDTHVHLNEPGRTEWEGFATGTRAASLGGVTTVLDMPLNSVPPTTTPAALATKREAARGQLSVDLGYWGGAVPQNLGHLEELWDAGVFGFKSFTLPSGVDEFEPLDRAQLLAAQREIAGFGGLHIVHCEDRATIEAAPAPASRAYADFLLSRPDRAEVAAITEVIAACRETGARTHILHLSGAQGADLVAAAKAEGLPLTAETCPHYLCLASESIPDAAPQYKCCPPIRDDGNRNALWDALLAGVIDIVVTDHSPATAERKFAGDGDLQQAWGGIAGVQVGFTAMLDEATRRGVSLERVADWMSVRPAEIVGLSAKGGLAAGKDADLAVWQASSPQVADVRRLAHKNPISAWDGCAFGGTVGRVWLRGAELDRGPDAVPAGRELFRR